MPKIGEVKITAKWLPPMDGGEPLPYWWDERLEKPTVCPRNLVCAARQNKRKVVRQLMACLDRQIKEGDLRRVDFASLAALGVLAKNVYLAIERERVRRFWRSEMMRFEESTRRPGQRLKAGVKTKWPRRDQGRPSAGAGVAAAKFVIRSFQGKIPPDLPGGQDEQVLHRALASARGGAESLAG